MRSSLLQFFLNFDHPDFCRACQELGYLSKKNSDLFLENVAGLGFAPSEKILFHASLGHSQILKEVVALLRPEQKIHFVCCQKCFKKFCNLKWEDERFALIVRTHEELIAGSMSRFSKNLYYLLSPDFDFDKWTLLDPELRRGVHFFCASESSNQILAQMKQIRGHDPAAHYSTPFSHDVIDWRNPDHLTWNFKPDLVASSSSDVVSPISPDLSVIVPFYNRRKLLVKVLDFLTEQNLDSKMFEVILMDDGSHDLSREDMTQLVRNYKSLNICYYYIDRQVPLDNSFIGNRVGPVRNLGGFLAKGRILLFLDADILLPKGYLSLVIEKHKHYDVTLPKRIYLNEAASQRGITANDSFCDSDFMRAPWDDFLNVIFEDREWSQVLFPWKYFMTYALSIRKELFEDAGGFRTSYISYGYEDLDLGFRILGASEKYSSIRENVFHLYHFSPKAEYDLSSFRRYFQLSLSSTTFNFQNMPSGSHDLDRMMLLKGFKQKLIFSIYSIFWKARNFMAAIKS